MEFNYQYRDNTLIEDKNENEGAIYLGNLATALERDILINLEIKFILSVIPQDAYIKDTIQGLEIKQIFIEAWDCENFDLSIYFEKAADFIKNSISKGNILIHCASGISRSTTCLIAYYIKYKNKKFEEALNYIAKKRLVQPNDGFKEQLRNYEQKYQKKEQIIKKKIY